MRVTREKLYEEIWAEPMIKVAARYGVSSHFLARLCTRLHVPRPPPGYWVQLEADKASPRPALPAARQGEDLEWSRDEQTPRVPRALPKPPARGRPARRHRARQDAWRHELVAGAKEHFEAAKVSDAGYMRPSKKRLVDLYVTNATLDRALEVANTLFLKLDARGHRVMFAPVDQPLTRPDVDERADPGDRPHHNFERWRPHRATVVYVGTVAIGLTIFELSEQMEARYRNGTWVRISDIPPPAARDRGTLSVDSASTYPRDLPSGRLCLRASSPYAQAAWETQWRENKAADLASKVPAIVRELESAAATIAELVAEGQRKAAIEREQWEAQEAKWRAEELERQRVQNTKKSREDLLAIIEAWGLAKQTENFFADAEKRAAGLEVEERDKLIERLRRGRVLVGSIDALERFGAWKAPEEL
jgi:hypothetical protein